MNNPIISAITSTNKINPNGIKYSHQLTTPSLFQSKYRKYHCFNLFLLFIVLFIPMMIVIENESQYHTSSYSTSIISFNTK